MTKVNGHSKPKENIGQILSYSFIVTLPVHLRGWDVRVLPMDVGHIQ